jgi:ribosomal protein L39E
MSIKSRISKLEKKKANQTKPAWVIVKDGDPIPEGVKCYHPSVSPDLWDEDNEASSIASTCNAGQEKSEVKNGKDN